MVEPTAPDDEHVDPIEVIADRFARDNVDEVRHLLTPELADALEEIIAVSLAHQPALRRMTRRLVPDPVVTSSGDLPAPGAATSNATSSDGKRGTGSEGR